jgi:hypothetical protein
MTSTSDSSVDTLSQGTRRDAPLHFLSRSGPFHDGPSPSIERKAEGTQPPTTRLLPPPGDGGAGAAVAVGLGGRCRSPACTHLSAGSGGPPDSTIGSIPLP